MNRIWIGIFGLVAVMIGLVLYLGPSSLQEPKPPPTWSEFKANIERGDYSEVVVGPMEVRAIKKGEDKEFDRVVRLDDPELLPLLESKGVNYRAARPSP